MQPKFNPTRDPKVCEVCGKPATRRVGVVSRKPRGACERHKDVLSQVMQRQIEAGERSLEPKELRSSINRWDY